MASYTSTPSFLPRSMAAPTGLPALPCPWFMQSMQANSFSCQTLPLVFSASPILPVAAPVLQHHVFHSASPVSPNQASKSFMIDDILGATDLPTSRTSIQATGKSKM